MAKPRRRQAGEGGISEYMTKAGPRFLIKFTAQRADGTKRVVLKRGFKTRRDAAAALRAEVRKTEVGEWVEPSKHRLDAYLAEWVQAQRLSPSTLASYRKNIRLHIDPYLGSQPVARLTGPGVDAWMRRLEESGRADGQGGLSARTVRYVYTILRSALGDAVKQGRLSVNPTDRSTPPSPSEARPPEMQAWTAAELGRFLGWAEARDRDLAMGWRLLAATGMRRGEALALRWRDVDLDAGRLAVRRSIGVVKTKGAGERLVEGPTKTGRARVVDLDAGTVAALRAYRAARGLLALDLVRDSALVLSNLDGSHRHPERFSRRFAGQVVQARKALGVERLPAIRLHDLRHTHATLLLADGVPVKVVSERLGHASATITLTVYQHVHPGMGRQAADRFAALLEG
ncbi:site-specific integrase [Blastococcus sp. MG754426]|uniref:tyrosine-type recombinase/integrase n=1 Tax=unclassified Blastococcus TaxID=2619396 RepID=UPI001EF0E802|nr:MULTISPECIES: site-specific integrase [unclassified Blastococcus]MCF6509071.1 site-specific integrase [Blastococcus sp. MG754426]MCF6513689.1 site-specific integrase [Blastococcus sp. MG754427]MCF6734223.1 site-specific integrase [Blastococcus sp. KM273129]